jgi:hypothetical protein
MANGQKVSWSIDEYLTSLSTKAGALIDAQETPVDNKAKTPKAESTPTLATAAVAGAK